MGDGTSQKVGWHRQVEKKAEEEGRKTSAATSQQPSVAPPAHASRKGVDKLKRQAPSAQCSRLGSSGAQGREQGYESLARSRPPWVCSWRRQARRAACQPPSSRGRSGCSPIATPALASQQRPQPPWCAPGLNSCQVGIELLLSTGASWKDGSSATVGAPQSPGGGRADGGRVGRQGGPRRAAAAAGGQVPCTQQRQVGRVAGARAERWPAGRPGALGSKLPRSVGAPPARTAVLGLHIGHKLGGTVVAPPVAAARAAAVLLRGATAAGQRARERAPAAGGHRPAQTRVMSTHGWRTHARPSSAQRPHLHEVRAVKGAVGLEVDHKEVLAAGRRVPRAAQLSAAVVASSGGRRAAWAAPAA